MEPDKIKELWNIWKTSYLTSTDLTERLVASDVLDLICEIVVGRANLICHLDPLTKPERAVDEVIAHIGINKKSWNHVRLKKAGESE